MTDGFRVDGSYVTTSKYITTTSASHNSTVAWAKNSTVAGISEDALLEALKRLQKKNLPKTISLNCPNCGAPTSIAINEHILKCQYCRSAYFVGTELIRYVENEL